MCIMQNISTAFVTATSSHNRYRIGNVQYLDLWTYSQYVPDSTVMAATDKYNHAEKNSCRGKSNAWLLNGHDLGCVS